MALSDPVNREEVLRKYQEAVDVAHAENVYQNDILKILPRIRNATKLLVQGEYEESSVLLDEILYDLKLVESQIPKQLHQAFQLEWLKIYRDVIQKYAVLALLAYFFIQVPYFRRMIRSESPAIMGRIYLTILFGCGSIFFSLFDLMQYGETAWAFLDIQVVFLTLTGLIGGFWPGLAAGFLVGVFRLVLSLHFWIYFLIAIMAGAVGGLFYRKMRNIAHAERVSFICGSLVGMIHGFLVYVPMRGSLTTGYVALSILVLAALEGTAVFIFVAMACGILREQSRQDTEKELLKTQLLFLQAQISPHFLYNTLNTISAICAREEAPEAQRLILKLAEFLRGTLKRVDDQVTLREELVYIKCYVDIERARFRDRLSIEEDFEVSEESWETKIPFLILQPLVENAIKHGISKKEEGGTLKMKLRAENGMLECEISDTGVGMPQERVENIFSAHVPARGNGIGIKNINERLVRFYGPQFGLKFQSVPGQGTTVHVKIPLRKKASAAVR